jgi:D-alanyl-D-alanine dipeptidase
MLFFSFHETIRARSGSGIFLIVLLLLLPSQTFSQATEKRYRKSDLVELTSLDSTIKLDIRYATTNNFMKRRMYTEPRAFLQRSAAEALVRANTRLKEQGFGLLVFDGYRPWSVTKQFWDETPPVQRKFVANPRKGSRHNRGCAVDLSLYDLQTGNEITMPSPYDNFTEKAAANYSGGTEQERHFRRMLRMAMESEGFSVNPDEWWHFDYKGWQQYRVLDIPFEALPKDTQ